MRARCTSASWSPTVMVGTRAVRGFCTTIATSRPRIARNWSSLHVVRSVPSSVIDPAVRRSPGPPRRARVCSRRPGPRRRWGSRRPSRRTRAAGSPRRPLCGPHLRFDRAPVQVRHADPAERFGFAGDESTPERTDGAEVALSRSADDGGGVQSPVSAVCTVSAGVSGHSDPVAEGRVRSPLPLYRRPRCRGVLPPGRLWHQPTTATPRANWAGRRR